MVFLPKPMGPVFQNIPEAVDSEVQLSKQTLLGIERCQAAGCDKLLAPTVLPEKLGSACGNALFVGPLSDTEISLPYTQTKSLSQQLTTGFKQHTLIRLIRCTSVYRHWILACPAKEPGDSSL